jgi:hypothetical protein
LFLDALKTLQFIVEAAVYYNPKIFFLFSCLCLAAAGLSLTIGLLTHLASFFMLGVGAILAAIIVLSLGLACALLRQIMDGGGAVPPYRRPAGQGGTPVVASRAATLAAAAALAAAVPLDDGLPDECTMPAPAPAETLRLPAAADLPDAK